ALQLLSELSAWTLEPNRIVYNAALSALSQAFHWSKAIRWLNGASEVSISLACSALGQAERWSPSLALLNQLPQKRLEMNTIIGNSCLSSLSSWTWRWSCSKVLVQIKQRNIRVDTVTQNALLSWKWGEWTCAIKFLQQMMQQDVPADQCSWNALLSLFDKALQ
ncbi:unnamed protein product, partial [Durusdinium trenchii]